MARIVTVPTAAVSQATTAYTIGFVKLEVHNKVEDAIGAGSGTLVSMGKVRGILTAAHVLDNLPDRGTVGIVEYRGEGIRYRKRTIEMAHTSKIALRGSDFGPDGPDLGFLRLATETIGWFEAIGSFYNLLKHRSDESQAAPSQHSTDALVGMIDERTKDLPAVAVSRLFRPNRCVHFRELSCLSSPRFPAIACAPTIENSNRLLADFADWRGYWYQIHF